MRDVTFDSDEYLKEERLRERRNSNELLWENIEESRRWRISKRTEDKTDADKISIQFHHYHPATAQFYIAFSGTIQGIANDYIRSILLYGAARRASSIFRSITKLPRVAPLGRESPLSQEEMTEVNDCLLLLYVHYIGVIDAFSIAYTRVVPSLERCKERYADLLTEKFRSKIGSSELEKIFTQNDAWLFRVKDKLLNRFVHRVPPYVPPSVFRPAHKEEFDRLSEEGSRALAKRDMNLYGEIEEEKERLGEFFPWICFIDDNEFMPFHSTVLDDLFRFQVLALDLLEEILPRCTVSAVPSVK
ncbi:MAG: hypothetical protein INF93_09725 [Rhodobacter sp.]|nr:hypothetical protein [Rhodobacter sp.]